MERKIISQLRSWKSSSLRKPLVLRGARQVGKTWIMKDFGKTEYKEVIYINFEREKQLQTLFEQDFDLDRILLAFQIQSGIVPEPHNTLIILDEIQEANGGITSLKYFQEEKPEYHIIAAGSLLGVSLAGQSFPVGKVDFLEMFPMTFSEFLMAMDERQLLDAIKNQKWDIISTFRTNLIHLLKQYYFIGGMPEAVSFFAENREFRTVREIQNNIITAYDNDFSKHAPAELVPRIKLLWRSLPAQLAKENKKFIYGIVKQGARAREYVRALEWLEQYGLTYRVERVSKPGFPLRAYADINAFKLFALDVGLLAALTGINEKIILEGNHLFTEFKGALTEQYVLQQLISELSIRPYYWSHKTSSSEVDFLFDFKNEFYPIEVKAETNLQAKSLIHFHQKFNPACSLRFSLADFKKDDWVINLPLYGIMTIKEVI